MSLDASFDSFDSFQIRPTGTRRATAVERRIAAEQEAPREAPKLFHMAIDRADPDDSVLYVLLGTACVVLSFGVAWAILPTLLALA